MSASLARVYGVLRDLGEAGYKVRIAVQVLGQPPLPADLLERLRVVKPDLIAAIGSWKPGDDVLTWPQGVFEEYARTVADGLSASLIPDPETYERFRKHNIVEWDLVANDPAAGYQHPLPEHGSPVGGGPPLPRPQGIQPPTKA